MENKPKGGRAFGIMVLAIEIGILFAYGYGSEFLAQSNQSTQIVGTQNLTKDNSALIVQYVVAAIVAILGYGMLLGYSFNSALVGVTITVISVGLTIQLQPLLLTFWDKVYFDRFNGADSVFSFDVLRIVMACCCSLLLAFTALIGRIGILESLFCILIFNIGWPCSFIACQKVYVENDLGNNSPAFDDNGTDYIYAFAGAFGMMTSLILNIKSSLVHHPSASKHSAAVALIGTGFIFASFPFTGIFFPAIANASISRHMISAINIYFCLSASVVCTYIFSAICGRGAAIGVRETMVGVLSGGFMISVVSGAIGNLGACIAIGAMSGVLSGVWLRVCHRAINRGSPIDNMGLLGPVLLNAIFGGFIVAPVLYKVYYDQKTNFITVGLVTDIDVPVYQLAYIGISVAAGGIFGLLAGILSLCSRNQQTDYSFNKLFNGHYGLYHEQISYKPGNDTDEQIVKQNM